VDQYFGLATTGGWREDYVMYTLGITKDAGDIAGGRTFSNFYFNIKLRDVKNSGVFTIALDNIQFYELRPVPE